MPRGASRVKLDATEELGAEVVLVGPGSAERSRKAEELAEEHGYVPVPPYDDEVLMAGQGTIGAEILEDLPDVETVLVPVSGGGLIGGISAAIKSARPEVRVIGVEPELASDARASLKSGRLVEFPADQVARTVADGLRVEARRGALRAYRLRRRHRRRNGEEILKPCAAWRCGSGWSQSRAGP